MSENAKNKPFEYKYSGRFSSPTSVKGKAKVVEYIPKCSNELLPQLDAFLRIQTKNTNLNRSTVEGWKQVRDELEKDCQAMKLYSAGKGPYTDPGYAMDVESWIGEWSVVYPQFKADLEAAKSAAGENPENVPNTTSTVANNVGSVGTANSLRRRRSRHSRRANGASEAMRPTRRANRRRANRRATCHNRKARRA